MKKHIFIIFMVSLSVATADDYIPLTPSEHNASVLRILQQAETQDSLIFTGNIKAERNVMKQLVEAGYLFNPGGGVSEVNSKSPTGDYVRVKGVIITLKGRDYLREIRADSPISKASRTVAQFTFWVVTIVISTLLTLLISRYFDLWVNKAKKDN